MSNIELFQHDDWNVRVVDVDGEPWFVVADVCKSLGIANARDAVARLAEDGVGTADIIDSLGRKQTANVVDESGLYELIFQSRRPEAKEFRRWVTREVLPQIRKTGGYGNTPALPQTHAAALRELADQVERAEAAEQQLAIAAPKAEAYEAFLDSDGYLSLQDAAKILLWGPNKMIEKLRELRVLQSSANARNVPYQRYMRYFTVIAGTYERHGVVQVTRTTKVRPEGLDFLRRKLNGGDATLALSG